MIQYFITCIGRFNILLKLQYSFEVKKASHNINKLSVFAFYKKMYIITYCTTTTKDSDIPLQCREGLGRPASVAGVQLMYVSV